MREFSHLFFESTLKEIEQDFLLSPFNYIGGKRKLLPQLYNIIPENINTFVDLFSGGASVGINADCKKLVLNDKIKQVIEFYEFLKENSKETVENGIRFIQKKYGLTDKFTPKENYVRLRESYNRHPNPIKFYLLTCYDYNNKISFNNSGDFNATSGYGRSWLNPLMRERVYALQDFLKENNVVFSTKDFRDFNFSSLKKGDYVYCDPPYLNSSVDYTKDWSEEDTEDLCDILDSLNKRGIMWGLSECLVLKNTENTVLLKWLNKHRKYNIHHFDMSYDNSFSGSLTNRGELKNSDTDEVFITNL